MNSILSLLSPELLASIPHDKIELLEMAPLIPTDVEKQQAIIGGAKDFSRVQAEIEKEMSVSVSDYFIYQDDPVLFVEQEFGEYVPPDCATLMEAVRDYRSVIAKSANATGKSWSAARIALWFLLCFPGAQVYTAAAPPESNLRNVLWGEIGSLTHKLRDSKLSNFRITHLSVRHKGNDKYFLTGVTIPTSGTPAKREAAFAGKHAPFILFILDEADGIPPEVYRGIESCLSGGHTRLLMMFNPRHESGPVYIKERDGEAHVVTLTAFTHPNVLEGPNPVTGKDIVEGAVSRDITLRRINEWTEPLATSDKPDAECFNPDEDCPFLIGLTTKSLAGVEYPRLTSGWRRIINPQFSYMVLGQYPAAADGQLISRAWIKRARDRWTDHVAKFGERPPKLALGAVQGLDMAEMGNDSTVSCIRYGGFVKTLQMWSKMETPDSAKVAYDIHRQYRCVRTCVDGNGFGSGVSKFMQDIADEDERYQEGIDTYSVKVQVRPTVDVEEGEFDRMRDQLWWLTRLWLRHDPNAMLPPDDELEEELATPTYVVDRGKIKIMPKKEMKEKLRRSPDRAESLILTFFNESVESEDPNGPLAFAVFNHRGI